MPGTDPSEKASCQTGLGNCGAWSLTSSTMISTCIVIVIVVLLCCYTFFAIGLISLQCHRSFCDCHPSLFQRVYVRPDCARGGALHLYGRRISSLLPRSSWAASPACKGPTGQCLTQDEDGKNGQHHHICLLSGIIHHQCHPFGDIWNSKQGMLNSAKERELVTIKKHLGSKAFQFQDKRYFQIVKIYLAPKPYC